MASNIMVLKTTKIVTLLFSKIVKKVKGYCDIPTKILVACETEYDLFFVVFDGELPYHPSIGR
jgi:hypothetical protein